MGVSLAAALLLAIAPVALAGDSDSDSHNGSDSDSDSDCATSVCELAEEVDALRDQVAYLQEQLEGLLNPTVDFSGCYFTIIVEWSLFGCSDTVDPLSGAEGDGSLLRLILNSYKQYISETTTRSAVFIAKSNGTKLDIPSRTLVSQGLRLSGLYEPNEREEDAFALDVLPNGVLSVEPDDQASAFSFSGRFAADGKSFVGLFRRTAFEEGLPGAPDCYDVTTGFFWGQWIPE
jgi:hypothetical protein